MHPTEEVTVTTKNEAIAIVAQPGWNRDTYGRPLVGAALGKALQLEHTVIEINHTILIGRLAEAGGGGHLIDALAIHQQLRLDIIQIAIAPRPEMQAGNFLRSTANSSLPRLNRHGLSGKTGYLFATSLVN